MHLAAESAPASLALLRRTDAGWRLRQGCKRLFDLTSSLMLLLLASPFMLAIALAVRLESRGPVFFRQTRRGRGYHAFSVVKFRSMAHGRPDPHQFYETLGDDPRITRVGRFLRHTSLDELPQLLNVVTGEMSLVGPRPLVEWESEKALITHAARFLVRPGITGLSQVEGRNSFDFYGRLDKDVDYVGRWSLRLDAAILLRTPLAVIRPEGIYPVP